MSENKYYDGTKLLSMKDINGLKPELFLCTTNRSGGKTTYFGRLLINRFLKYGKKFCLIYRYNYELDDVSNKFFKDLQTLFFSNYTMESERCASGIYHSLFLNEQHCGYAISLNSADQLKKYSHLLSDTDSMLFDEFQSETNHYCSDEIRKFISVHTSIARGHGEQARYLPVYMLSNAVSIINPYYTELGISERLNSETNFLKGDGFVLESGFIETASKAQKESGFNRAFKNNQYVAYSSENVYLNDNTAFIDTPVGKGKYVATLRYMGHDYGVKQYSEQGFLYIDDKADSTFRCKISVTVNDHDINYIMLKQNDLFISQLRYYFEKGCFRFKNLKCKEVLFKTISY